MSRRHRVRAHELAACCSAHRAQAFGVQSRHHFFALLVAQELLLLARARVYVIVQDNNDQYWFLGAANGLEMTAGTAGTGTAFGDRSGYELTLSGMEPNSMLNIATTVFAVNTAQIQGA